jgi:hypothetical protein
MVRFVVPTVDFQARSAAVSDVSITASAAGAPPSAPSGGISVGLSPAVRASNIALIVLIWAPDLVTSLSV